MDKKETTVTQCLSTPVRDKPGSLLSENGGHSLLPSPLSPIPHTEAQTRALAHPRRRTREICGDYNPTFWKIHSQVRMHARTHGRGDARFSAWTPIFHRERCCHKIITIQSEERETNTMKLPSEPGNSFHWSSKEHVVLTHQTAKRVGKQQLS